MAIRILPEGNMNLAYFDFKPAPKDQAPKGQLRSAQNLVKWLLQLRLKWLLQRGDFRRIISLLTWR